MIKSQSNIQARIIPEFSLPEHQTIKRVLLFLKNVLPEFERDFQAVKQTILLEDAISKQLSLFFQLKAKSENLLFDFNPRIGVDFGIHVSPLQLGADPIFVIEAKRLSKQHYDYVKGETGGIERFKREFFGFGKHLSKSAMIGYIQEQKKEHWLPKVNSWIDEAIKNDTDSIWTEEDKLVAENNISDYISTHLRVSGTTITLYHFWLSLN
ncbi:MAG: hypothetical protein Q8R96_20835 [Bacteroidota bacterium]|nr:hypothetical protein [Bacteroidota bacterium]